MIAIGGKAALTAESRALLTPKMADGLSLIFAPKGYGAVIYVMEFPWDADSGLVGTLLADHALCHLKADPRWIDTTSARLHALAELVNAS